MKILKKLLISLFVISILTTAPVMMFAGSQKKSSVNACEKQETSTSSSSSSGESSNYTTEAKQAIKNGMGQLTQLSNRKAKHMPVDTGYVSAAFGETQYHTVPHNGTDIAATGNAYAIIDGVVIENRFNSARGYLVVIAFLDVDNVWRTYMYQHLANVSPAQVGKVVHAGEVVGTSGNTGDSQGVHLHMETADTTLGGDGIPQWVNHAQKESGLYDSITFWGIPDPITSSSGSTTPVNNPTGNRCTSNGSTVTNLQGNSNVEKTWNFFKEKGFTKEAVAGIIGNFMVESQLDPLAGETGGNGGGRGIAQWGQCGVASNGANAGCRWKELENWAAANGNQNPDELSIQLGFAYYEMEQRGLIEYFKTVTTVYTTSGGAYGGGAVGYFCEKFEAPAVQYAHMDKRHSYAMDALAKFGG